MVRLDDIPQTPALVIDEKVAAANLSRLATYAKNRNIGIRPHTKTHKSLEMAARQLRLGAVGLTAAKVGEAEAMANAGDDLLLAYPASDPARTVRLATLAKTKTVRVAVDSAYAADALAGAARSAGSTIGILVDLDVGMHRTGLQSPAAALDLAQHISRSAGLRLDGLFCYPGHVWSPAAEQAMPLAAVSALLAETLSLWSKAGLSAKIVSGGSTPTAYQSHLIPQLTEIRPGTYIYNDMNTVAGGFASLDDCAAVIVATVVSTAVPGQVVIDAGSKTLTSDRCIPKIDSGFGHVIGHAGAKVAKLSEEHGQIDVTTCDRPPKIGERVAIIPNHICPCVNLQDSGWLRSAETGRLQPLKIDTRGLLS